MGTVLFYQEDLALPKVVYKDLAVSFGSWSCNTIIDQITIGAMTCHTERNIYTKATTSKNTRAIGEREGHEAGILFPAGSTSTQNIYKKNM